MPTPPPRMWVNFVLNEDYERWRMLNPHQSVKMNRYIVDSSNVLRGEEVCDFKPADEIVRVCSNEPLGGWDEAAPVLAGCTQHLHYTTDAQRDRLVAMSAREIAVSEKPLAVAIPIRKSDAWWNLGQNERMAYMNGSGHSRGHTAIGEEYAPLIFRQLLHSRYLDSSKKSYDFLTYFEFTEANRDWFKMLLARLRDAALNPEWQHVEMEQEVWMRKVE